MTKKLTYKQRQAQAKRIKYWQNKCKNTGLIYHVLDSEMELKAMFAEWQESQGKPTIPDEDLKPTEMQGTNVGEFYKIKKSWEKEKDQEWEWGLNKSGVMDRAIVSSSPPHEVHKTSLIFDRPTAKTKIVVIPSDTDEALMAQKLRDKKRRERKREVFI